MEDTKPTTPKSAPPPNPFAGGAPKNESSPAVTTGATEDRLTLDEGPVLIRWPGQLSVDSFNELEYFLKGLIARARRKAGLKPTTIEKAGGNTNAVVEIEGQLFEVPEPGKNKK